VRIKDVGSICEKVTATNKVSLGHCFLLRWIRGVSASFLDFFTAGTFLEQLASNKSHGGKIRAVDG